MLIAYAIIYNDAVEDSLVPSGSGDTRNIQPF
jgi:hypothetical protein